MGHKTLFTPEGKKGEKIFARKLCDPPVPSYPALEMKSESGSVL